MWLIWLIIEATVVLLPVPVGPVNNNKPRRISARQRTFSGKFMSSNVGIRSLTIRVTNAIDPR